MCLEVMFLRNESFVGLCFIVLDNETFSQHHFYNKFRKFFVFKRFVFENLRKPVTTKISKNYETTRCLL